MRYHRRTMSYRLKFSIRGHISIIRSFVVLKRPSGYALKIQVSINRNESRFQIVSLPYGKT